MKTLDVFISYASEDLEFAEALSRSLNEVGHAVWFAPFQLKLGDSLVQKINDGLRQTRVGLVIISPAFLHKEWPLRELHALTALMVGETTHKLIPVLHKLGHSTFIEHLPLLADILYISSADGIASVVTAVATVISGEPAATLPSKEVKFESNGRVQSFRLLSDALIAAPSEATLYIYPGTYEAGISIEKPVHLVGRGSRHQTILEITATDTLRVVAEVEFRGLTIVGRTTINKEISGVLENERSLPPLFRPSEALICVEDGARAQAVGCILDARGAKKVLLTSTNGSVLLEECTVQRAAHGVTAGAGGECTFQNCEFIETEILLQHFAKAQLANCRLRSCSCQVTDESEISVKASLLHKSQIHAYEESKIFISDDTRFEGTKKDDDHGAAVYLNHFSHGSVTDSTLDGVGRAFYLYGGSYLIARNVVVKNALWRGMYFSEGCSGVLERCVIENSAEDGIHLQKGANPTLRYCTVQGNQGAGISLNQGAAVVIEHSTVVRNGKNGITADSGEVLLKDSKVFLNDAPGIDISSVVKLRLERCEIGQNRHGTIVVDGAHWFPPNWIETLAGKLGKQQHAITVVDSKIY